eukprot:COSAG06_NODE_1936_length_8030_cov_4.318245_2_plen_127_part_00
MQGRWVVALCVAAAAGLAGSAHGEEIEVTDPSEDDLRRSPGPPGGEAADGEPLNLNVDDAMVEELKKAAADGSDRVDKESIVTSESGNIADLLRDAGFAPAPPWQSGKRAVRKAARCRACEVCAPA